MSMASSRRPRPPAPVEKPSRPHQLCAPKIANPHPLPWVVLDRFVQRIDDAGDEVADGPLWASSSTCSGVPIAVSLIIAELPAVSRLYLHWPEGVRPELTELSPPYVVAAHGHTILLQTYAPLSDIPDPYYYPIDYFVYTAHSCPGKPSSLRRLPTCLIGVEKNPEMDWCYWGSRCKPRRMMSQANIGLLCRGDVKFTVAQLNCVGELCLLHHVPGEKGDMTWDLKKLRMPREDGTPTPNILYGSWITDTIIPFSGSYLCWIDVYLGLLFVDVISKRPKPPCYAPLPAALDPRRVYIDFGVPDPARRVCVTDTGMIKLICISDVMGRSLFEPSCPHFLIRTWTLCFKKMQWEMHTTMDSREFWAALDSDNRLPSILPEFPIMSLVDSDVIYFMLNGVWMVEVNMKKKEVLRAVPLYINEKERYIACKFASGNLLIPSQFTRYLKKDAIGRLVSSKKVQKGQHEAAMEKEQSTGSANGRIL